MLGFRVSRGPGDGVGTVLVENSSPFPGAAPRQGAVGQGFGKDDCCPGRAGDPGNERRELPGQIHASRRQREVALVGGGHTRKAAVIGSHVPQIECHGGQTGMHPPVLNVVILGRVERGTAAMQRAADRTQSVANDIEVDVIQAKIRAHQGIEPWKNLRMVNEIEVWLAPLQDTPKAVGGLVRHAAFGDMPVGDGIQRGDLGRCQRVLHHQESLQVKKIRLLFSHREAIRDKELAAARLLLRRSKFSEDLGPVMSVVLFAN